ncbi:MAG: sugar fermentation stimulation protein SfsA, partial [Lacticaseibacillus paracasei]
MYYQNVSVGQLIKRVSRFTVEIDLNGTVEPVHMNNTGRNKEILIPGSLASVRYVDNPNRKTHYDLLAVQRQGRWINIDSLAPNHVAKECLEAGT